MDADQFQHWDGAYVLGALSDAERDAFEEHLLTCEACRARVAEVAVLPQLLAGVSAGDLVDDAGPVPETLLPRLLRAADAQRRRTRLLFGALGAVAAACLAALVLVLAWPSSSDKPNTAPTQAVGLVRAMQPSRSGIPLSATVQLSRSGTGTDVKVRCTYHENEAALSPSYTLVVFDRGRRQAIGWWQVEAGQTATFLPHTTLSPSQITRVEIELSGGRPVLYLNY